MIKALDHSEMEPLIVGEAVGLKSVISRMVARRKCHAVIVDDAHRPVGVVSTRDILRAVIVEAEKGVELVEYQDLREALLTPISYYMTRNPVVADLDIGVWEAARLMVDRGIGCLPLVDENGILKALVLESGLAPLASRLDGPEAENIMSSPIISVDWGDLLVEAAGLMYQYGVRRIMVRGPKPTIVTSLDILAEIVRPGALEKLHKGVEDPLGKPVHMVSHEPPLIRPHQRVSEIAELVAKNPLECGLVVEDKLMGIITVRDIVATIALGDPRLWEA